jgi:membrane fusion protein (multidrug efflux system)
MSAAFTRSMRLLEADGGRRSLVSVGVVLALLAGWSVWFFGVPVPVYEVSDAARLEVGQVAYPVAAVVGGRIAKVHLELGQVVKKGDVLVELDSHSMLLSLQERKARLAALVSEIQPLADQVAATERALNDAIAASKGRVAEAYARSRESNAALEFATGEAERQKKLRENGLATDADVARLKAEMQMRRAASEEARIAAGRVESEERNKESDLRANIARLKRDTATLEGQRATEEASVATLAQEIDVRRVRAPIDGKVGEMVALQEGGVLKEGDKIGVIVPTGALKVIAELAPASALGRVMPGQPARLRLDGFPWTQYGDVKAVVSSVASEARDGRARVELAIQVDPASPIPLQHGLPGVVEIEVDRAPPVMLVLRAAGLMLRSGRPPEPRAPELP